MSEASDPSEVGSPAPQAGDTTQAYLYDKVFGDGSDSELSDLSDDDEPRKQPARKAFPPRQASGSASPRPAVQAPQSDEEDEVDDDKDEDEDDVDGEGDVYVPATATTPAKIPKFKKKSKEQREAEANDDEAGGADEEDESRRRKKKKKSRRVRSEREIDAEDDQEETMPVLDAAEQRRLALEERIDNIGKKMKPVRRKRKGDDVDIVDNYHDEVCVRLRDRMIAAAEKDRVSNEHKQPATAKLAMLEEVMNILRNTFLWQSVVDNGVLEAVRLWLEPIAPSGALPAVGIQKALFEVLPKMDLDTTTLKECRLGPIVLFYTKTKRVTPAINRQADALVSAWSRPIIKRSSNFHSRQLETLDSNNEPSQVENADGGDEMDVDQVERPKVAAQPFKRKRFNVREALKENEGRKGARVYIGGEIQYTIAPEIKDSHHSSNQQHISRIQNDNRKFNKFARQMQQRKTR